MRGTLHDYKSIFICIIVEYGPGSIAVCRLLEEEAEYHILGSGLTWLSLFDYKCVLGTRDKALRD